MELLFLFGFFLLVAVTSMVSRSRRVIESLAVLAAVVALAVSLPVAMKVASDGTYSPYQFFSVDALAAILMLLISTVAIAAAVYSVAYLRRETEKGVLGFTRVQQYFVLFNLFVAVMVLAAVSNNPIFTWISIEATTLSTAFLISFYNKASSMEAAWKFLVINAIGLLLAFFGTLLYFTSVHGGAAMPTTWASLLANAGQLDPMIAKIAFVFVVVGYGTKVGLAPMHTWKPDTYSKAPAPIGALFSGALMPVALVTILKFRLITDASVGPAFTQGLLITFGLLSLAVGALIVLTARNYKRLLAYSSIEHAGIMVLGLGFGGLGVLAALLHLIYHSLLKPSLFFSAGNFLLRFNSDKIKNICGAMAALPWSAGIFFLGFLAITGAPPFGILLSETMIASAGMQAHPLVVTAMVLLMAVFFVGFFRHMLSMSFGEVPTDVERGERIGWLVVPSVILVAVALYLSWSMPSFLQTLIHSAAQYSL